MRFIPYLYLIAGMATVGSYVALSKPLIAAIPIFILASLRFFMAAVLMLPWLSTSEKLPKLSLHDKLYLFVQSLLGNFLFSICMLFGVAYSDAVTAGIVMAAIPAAVAVLSWLVLKEHIEFKTKAAIFLSCAAVLTLSFGKSPVQISEHYTLGVALLIAAVFCEASYVVLAKKLSGVIDPKRNSALLNLWGLCLMLPLGIWQYVHLSYSLNQISTLNWLVLLYYAIAASILSTWLWFTGLKHVPANKAGVFTVALPVTSALLGVTVFNELFTMWHGIAFVLALFSVLLTSYSKKRVDHE